MKKILLVLLALIICAGMTLCVSAETSSAIEDGDFEASIGAVYANDGQSQIVRSEDVYLGGNASLLTSNRSNKWGAAAWNVTDYMQAKGEGKYYCTLYVTGNFSGSIRATLHTNHASRADVYRNIAVMTPFTNEAWTYVGADAEGNALPMGAENWNIDYSEWDMVIPGDVTNAVLYFWIEGDDFGDVYIDNINFWHESDTPVSYSVSETPKLPAANSGEVSISLEDDETSEAVVTDKPETSGKDTQKPAESGSASESGNKTGLIIGICAAVIVVLAIAAVILTKKKK
ncbi:MAG: hypothetical protein IKS28_04650 [Clostridia bacterium]|nr:hypothetical protein [Clostridia bacterium]